MSFAYLPLYTGDYIRDTQHLSCSEHGIYLKLLIHCWDQKGPVPLDERRLLGIVNARSTDEIEAMRRVLLEYFVRMDDGWYNRRMQKEIERCENISSSRSDAGKKGYQAKAKQMPSKCLTLDEQVPLSPSPSPSLTPTSEDQKIKPPRDKRASPSARVEVSESEMMGSGITQTVASEYLRYRRAKKALLTPLAWRRILSEIDKSGIGVEGALSQAMARGWQGFEADWLREKNRAGPQTGQYHESERDIRSRTRREFLEQINGKPDQRGAVSAAIDGEAIRVD